METNSAKRPLLHRLGSFAVTHFIYSICASHCTLLLTSLPGLSLLELSPALSYAVLLAYAAVLVLLYLPLGLLVGRNLRASIATPDDALRATALEAGLAWVWAGAVIAGVFSSTQAEPWLGWLAWLAMASFLLAYPSSILVLMGLALTGADGTMMELDALGLWVFWAFWAGLLPPLLFNLGCLWTPRRNTQGETV